MSAKKRAARKTKPAKAGRPSSYKDEYPAVAAELALAGATDDEMADYFDVARSTFYEWKKTYPDFADAIKRAKLPADAAVIGALYNRARGAEWVEEQAIKLKRVEYKDGKRVLEDERVEIVLVTRRAPPDTTAAIFWAKNRRPNEWRDRAPEPPQPDAADVGRHVRTAVRAMLEADGIDDAA